MKLDKLFNALLIIIAAFPLIGMRLTILIIILFCVTAIIITLKDKLYKNALENWKTLLFLSSYYLLAIFSFIFFTTDYQEGLKDLETKAAFIVFPVFIYLCRSKISKKLVTNILKSFVASNIISAIYVWILIFNEGFFKVLKEDNFYNPVFRKFFAETTDIHLPYLGLLFGFSCLILTHYIIRAKVKVKLFFLLLIVVLLSSMFIFSARMAIFASFLGVIYYLLRYLSKKSILVVIASVLIVSVILSFFSPVKRRINELTNTELSPPDKSQNSVNVNFRYGIYYCSKEILKEHWLMGLGIGSVQKELNNCYQGFTYRNYDDFLISKYNSHNQYLNAWMTYGIFGLFFIFFYLAFSFYKSNALHQSFLLIMALALLTENLFQREIGVMLFAFFNTLFVVFKNKEKAQ